MQMQTVFNILNHWNRLILGLGQSLRLFRLKVSQRRSLSLREQPQLHPTSASWQFSSSVFIFLFFKAGPSSSSSSCSSSDSCSCSFNENGDVSLLGLLLLGFEKIFNSINFRFENLVLVLVKIFYFRVRVKIFYFRSLLGFENFRFQKNMKTLWKKCFPPDNSHF